MMLSVILRKTPVFWVCRAKRRVSSTVCSPGRSSVEYDGDGGDGEYDGDGGENVYEGGIDSILKSRYEALIQIQASVEVFIATQVSILALPYAQLLIESSWFRGSHCTDRHRSSVKIGLKHATAPTFDEDRLDAANDQWLFPRMCRTSRTSHSQSLPQIEKSIS